jgi:hypothetical protein
MKTAALLLTICLSTSAFAKSEAAKKSERNPANDAVETVKATSLRQAWARIVKKNPNVRAVLKKARAAQKECGGTLGTLNENGKMVTYHGKGGLGNYYNEMLIPMIGGCSGTGMIEQAVLVVRIGVNSTVGEDDAETEDTYHFFGFTKITNHPITAPDQSSGLEQ